MNIAGLDVGTTGCKICVYNENAELLDTRYKEYFANRGENVHEIDFCDIGSAVFEVIKAALSKNRVDAIGVTGFGETFALLDEKDRVLLPSMLYTDPRGEEQVKKLCGALTSDWITEKTGAMPHQMYSIYKLMWLKENRVEEFKKARAALLSEDYIVYLLTGNRKIDYSLAARTGAFDIEKKCWINDVFDAAGIDKKLMSEPVETGNIAGSISTAAKEKLGVSYDITVVNGAHDQVAAMIGAGVLKEKTAMDGTGTVECIPIVLNSIPKSKSMYACGYSVVPFVGGKYACYALSYTGGAVLKWFRDNFCQAESEKAKELNENVYKLLDDEVPQTPTNLLVKPHFAGAATPYMDSSQKAAITGLTLGTTKQELYKALMEGTAYEIKLNFKLLERYTKPICSLRATGGGASSDVWLGIKADVLNTEIAALDCKEVGAAGTAALAGVAMGVFRTLHFASAKTARIRKVFLPDPKRAEFYEKQFKKYSCLYDALKNL